MESLKSINIRNFRDTQINFDISDLSELDEYKDDNTMDSSQGESTISSHNWKSPTGQVTQSAKKNQKGINKPLELNETSIVINNLDKETDLVELEKLFSKFGIKEKVNLVYKNSTKYLGG